jgi:hypothetical protein
MTNKRFDQTGDIKAFKVLTPGYDALLRSDSGAEPRTEHRDDDQRRYNNRNECK